MSIPRISRGTFLKLGSVVGVGAIGAVLRPDAANAAKGSGIRAHVSRAGVVRSTGGMAADVEIDGVIARLVPLRGFPPGYLPAVGERVVATRHGNGRTLVAMPLVTAPGRMTRQGGKTLVDGVTVQLGRDAASASKVPYGPGLAWLTSNVKGPGKRVIAFT